MKKKLTIVICVILMGIILAIKMIDSEKIEIETKKVDDVYEFIYPSDATSIYSVSANESAYNLIEDLKDDSDYDEDNVLAIYNPYRTNNLSMYIYFETDTKLKATYTIHVDDETIVDYSNDLDGSATKTHEYNLIGLVGGEENYIIIDLYDENTLVDTIEITYEVDSIEGSEEVVLSSDNNDTTLLEDGLYAILGNDSDDQDYIYLYDNNGILRGEIPIIGYRAHNILFNDDKMYYSISETKIAEVNNLGQVSNVYKLDHYNLHHDYTFDEDGNILILASDNEQDSVEDCIIKLNVQNGEVDEVLDLEDLFGSYKETCYFDSENGNSDGEEGLDWMHLNSIEYIDGDIIVSSRETSSIIKIDDIESDPKINYIIADSDIWAGSEYEKYVYTQVNEFNVQAGQHYVRYVAGEEEGVYYLTLFNNNYGKATTQPDLDYSSIIDDVNTNWSTGDNSQYYEYKVDENNHTFELVNSFDVPYSGIVSSAQTLNNNNILVDSGTKGIFSEYDENGNIIKTYEMKLSKYMIYRVLKYDFNNFYFNK